MPDEYKKGDTLVHKASGNIVVVLFWGPDNPFNIKCRCYNPITGHYEMETFDTREFIQKRELKLE
jgi:hypothetical protein